ncbi:MAG: hypothetical protein Q8M24_21000, partial [Pseudolabrys sp.]|nr:hypothetical protein [Pseudolabrys sp.]
EHRTNVGYYTINALELNRQSLRRLRELRERLADCNEYVSKGLMGLRKFQLDALPSHLKGRAARAIQNAYATADQIGESIDALLRAHAHSPLIDRDVESTLNAKERARNLKQVEAIHPGAWRGRNMAPKKP